MEDRFLYQGKAEPLLPLTFFPAWFVQHPEMVHAQPNRLWQMTWFATDRDPTAPAPIGVGIEMALSSERSHYAVSDERCHYQVPEE